MFNKTDEVFLKTEIGETQGSEKNQKFMHVHIFEQSHLRCNSHNDDSNRNCSLELEDSHSSFSSKAGNNHNCIEKGNNIIVECNNDDGRLDFDPSELKGDDHQSERIAKKKPFTLQEDQVLLSLVTSIGEKNWASISTIMKQMNFDRNGRQCRDRYYHYLDPKINNDNVWTPEEEELLLKTVEQNGKKWKWMEKIFPGRTEVSLRNRYHLILRKKLKKENKKVKRQNIMSSDFDFLDNYNSKNKRNLKLESNSDEKKNKSICGRKANLSQNHINAKKESFKIDESIVRIFNDPGSISLFDEDFHDVFNFDSFFFM